jgi:hypothetical protein
MSSVSMSNMSVIIREDMIRSVTSSARDLAIRAVSECASKYGFSAEEAIRSLCLDDVTHVVVEKKSRSSNGRGGSVEKKKVVRCAFPLPYNGETDDKCCSGLRLSEGLYTQCRVQKKGDKTFCKVCEEQAVLNNGIPEYGTITERKACYDSNTEFKDPKGKSPVAYCRIMKKYKVTEAQVVTEAGKQGMTVNPVHFTVVEGETKRGRPKSNLAPKEPKGPKGRPKKSKKVLEIDGGEDDLFASLVASANEDETTSVVSEIVSETVSETASKTAKEAEKAAKAQEKEAEKATKAQEKEAEKLKKEAEKEAEKLKKEQEKALKAAEKLAKETEKATKAAEKEAEKLAKEAAKATKEAEKVAKEAAKASKASKETEKKSAKSDGNDEPDVVKKFEFEGKKYLKSKKTGIIYNMEQDVIGKWNDVTNKIDFSSTDEEEEEEYEEEEEE